ncbi:hypothetical protein GCM10010124_14020 [Pilimelia terevasa]|uniref:Peptidase M16 N-terminal domain-containing protein n=1 Tax=Pilimelia terevasa TaxID=53372 RepID=A0A8J3BN04_9ACTN|nr:insulinase family protein [Pilimelia terevasa]GGK22687.1 hypothetical protein GCM10010124_14020 [Pilimelia terevasa]
MTGPRSAGIRAFNAGGLAVRYEVLPWARSFAACLVVDCGSRDDPAGLSGTAHLAEHLHGLAAPAGPGAGIPLLAVTDVDRTCFEAAGDPVRVAPLLRRLLAIAAGRRPPADRRVFEGERQAVLLETRRMDHQPLLRLGPLLAAAAAAEPGLDAVGRTTTESVRRITPADVDALAVTRYVPAAARLFLAGPPSPVPEVVATLGTVAPLPADPPTAGSRPAAGPPLSAVAGLDGILAVTLVRPRGVDSAVLDALLADEGPIVDAAGEPRRRPGGRTTIAGRAQQVDVVCWAPGAATAGLGDRLAETATGDWQALAGDVARRDGRRRRNQHHLRHATPLRRVSEAARRAVLGPPDDTRELAWWRIADGVPVRLARYPLGPHLAGGAGGQPAADW